MYTLITFDDMKMCSNPDAPICVHYYKRSCGTIIMHTIIEKSVSMRCVAFGQFSNVVAIAQQH